MRGGNLRANSIGTPLLWVRDRTHAGAQAGGISTIFVLPWQCLPVPISDLCTMATQFVDMGFDSDDTISEAKVGAHGVAGLCSFHLTTCVWLLGLLRPPCVDGAVRWPCSHAWPNPADSS